MSEEKKDDSPRGPTDPLLLKAIKTLQEHRSLTKEERRQVLWDRSRQTCEVCGVKMTTSVFESPKKCEQCSRR